MKIRRMATLGIAILAAGAIGMTLVGVASATAHTAPQTTAANGAGQLIMIDAATDKDAAIDALKLYPDATHRSFTPYGDPSYAQTGWTPVTDENGHPIPSITGNAKTGQKITERLTISHEESSSYSLGGSVETSVGFDLAGVVDAELSLKFTGNHTWSSSASDSQGIWITADPGKTVWIEASSSTATYSGDFQFDSDGNHYLVKNVKITQPAAPAAANVSPINYRIMQVNSTVTGQAADTTGGLKAINALPGLQSYINNGH